MFSDLMLHFQVCECVWHLQATIDVSQPRTIVQGVKRALTHGETAGTPDSDPSNTADNFKTWGTP